MSKMRPSESVIAAKVPLGDRVSFSPFLGLSFKHVRGIAANIKPVTIQEKKSQLKELRSRAL